MQRSSSRDRRARNDAAEPVVHLLERFADRPERSFVVVGHGPPSERDRADEAGPRAAKLSRRMETGVARGGFLAGRKERKAFEGIAYVQLNRPRQLSQEQIQTGANFRSAQPLEPAGHEFDGLEDFSSIPRDMNVEFDEAFPAAGTPKLSPPTPPRPSGRQVRAIIRLPGRRGAEV